MVDDRRREDLSKIVGYIGGPFYNIDSENLRILYMSEVEATDCSTSSSGR